MTRADHAAPRHAVQSAGGVQPPPLSREWALFLDMDGTLVDIQQRPDLVHIDDDLKVLLRVLSETMGGALALISGRSIEEIDRLIAPLRLPAAGQHGAERRSADGTVHRHAPQLEKMREAAERLTRFAARDRGFIVENKGMSLALHYRLAPQLRMEAEAKMRELANHVGHEFILQQGKEVLELKPSGRDKGLAVEEFLAEPPFAGRQPVFIGDDVTDEFGFVCVNRRAGHSVKVGSGPSAAAWRLADAAAVRRWLRGAVGQVSAQSKEDKV